MRVVIDITEMAKALCMDVEVVLEELGCKNPDPASIAEWLELIPPNGPRDVDRMQNFIGIASKFVKRE